MLGKELRSAQNNIWLNYAIPIDELRDSVTRILEGKFQATKDEPPLKPDEAIDLAKKNAGLTEARVVTYRRRGEYQNNIYSRVLNGGSGLASLANMDLLSIVRGGSPQFMYLWMP